MSIVFPRPSSDINDSAISAALLESVPLSVISVEGKLIGCNQALISLLAAASPQALIGSRFIDIFTLDEEAMTRWDSSIESLLSQFSIYSWYARESEKRRICWNFHLIESSGTYIAKASDCSLEESLRQKVSEVEQKFDAFMERSPAIAWMKDAGGCYRYANSTGKRMYGLSEDDFLGKDDFEIFPEEVAQVLVRNDRRALERAEPIETIEQLPAADGVTRSWYIWKFPFFHPNGETFVGGLAFDISDKIQVENTLRQIQRLETVGQLAAGLAHDFNNILTMQQGYLSLLKTHSDLPEDVTHILDQLEVCGHRAAGLTKQLLQFSRRQELQLKRESINALVARVIGALDGVIGKHIEIKVEQGLELPMVEVDPASMEQVLINLCLNAKDAMPSGGTLSLSTLQAIDQRHEALRSTAGTTFVCIEVRDSGAGIPAENLEKIFEPFFTTKEIGKGTGLGLSTAYGIVKQHRGWIEVESEEKIGSTFRVYIPAC